MSVSTTISRIVYTGNNSTSTPYPVPFRVLAETDIQVSQRTNLEPDADWTQLAGSFDVTLIEETGMAEVRTHGPWDNENEILIERVVPLTQPLEYPVSGPFPAKSHERGLDRLTMVIQQVKTDVESCLKLRTKPDQFDNTTFTQPTTGVLSYDEDRNPIIYTLSQLAAQLEGSIGPFDGTIRDVLSFDDADDRDATTPVRVGQLGVQLDDATLWISDGLAPGDWAVYTPGGPDGGAILSRLIIAGDSHATETAPVSGAGNAWPTQLRRINPFFAGLETVNLALNYRKASEIDLSFSADIAGLGAGDGVHLLVQAGTNDHLSDSRTALQIQTSLESIATKAKAAGMKVSWLTCPTYRVALYDLNNLMRASIAAGTSAYDGIIDLDSRGAVIGSDTYHLDAASNKNVVAPAVADYLLQTKTVRAPKESIPLTVDDLVNQYICQKQAEVDVAALQTTITGIGSATVHTADAASRMIAFAAVCYRIAGRANCRIIFARDYQNAKTLSTIYGIGGLNSVNLVCSSAPAGAAWGAGGVDLTSRFADYGAAIPAQFSIMAIVDTDGASRQIIAGSAATYGANSPLINMGGGSSDVSSSHLDGGGSPSGTSFSMPGNASTGEMIGFASFSNTTASALFDNYARSFAIAAPSGHASANPLRLNFGGGASAYRLACIAFFSVALTEAQQFTLRRAAVDSIAPTAV